MLKIEEDAQEDSKNTDLLSKKVNKGRPRKKALVLTNRNPEEDEIQGK